MLKVFSVSRDKKFYNVGEEKASAKWYGFSEGCASQIATIQWKDEVECKFENVDGKDIIVSISKVGATSTPSNDDSANKETASQPTPTAAQEPKQHRNYSGNDTSEQIKQLAIGHMVSRTIIGLQASIDINNMCSVIDTLWEKYSSKVNGN
jgi:hypothetical protein